MLSVSVTEVRGSPPWRGGGERRDAVGQAAWPCSLMGDEVICEGVITLMDGPQIPSRAGQEDRMTEMTGLEPVMESVG